MGWLLSWLAATNKVADWLAQAGVGLFLFGMVFVVIVSVYFRYVLNASLVWSEEVARYLSVWVVFLGISIAYRRAEHIRLTVIVDALPGRLRRVTALLVQLLELAMLALIAWHGWTLAMSNFARAQTTPALGIQIGWIYLAVPVGLGLAALQSLERIFAGLLDGPGSTSGNAP